MLRPSASSIVTIVVVVVVVVQSTAVRIKTLTGRTTTSLYHRLLHKNPTEAPLACDYMIDNNELEDELDDD